MHRPPDAARRPVYRPRTIEHAASAVVINAEIHRLLRYVVCEQYTDDGNTTDGQPCLETRIAEHAPSLASLERMWYVSSSR